MKQRRWVIGVYDKQFNRIKVLKEVRCTYKQAEKKCEVFQTRNPKLIIMFDHP